VLQHAHLHQRFGDKLAALSPRHSSMMSNTVVASPRQLFIICILIPCGKLMFLDAERRLCEEDMTPPKECRGLRAASLSPNRWWYDVVFVVQHVRPNTECGQESKHQKSKGQHPHLQADECSYQQPKQQGR
jgi:hypothetical protein